MGNSRMSKASDSDADIIDRLDSELLKLGKRPDFCEFYILKARLCSFHDWPKTLKQTPEQLSDAGFFYTQKCDRVICFCCGLGLKQWEDNDDPWEQHALYNAKCAYLLLIKGSEYIASIKEKFAVDEPDYTGLSSLFQEN